MVAVPGRASNYTFQESDPGQVTFAGALTLVTPGDKLITVTDTADSTITGGATVTVTAARRRA
jgi:hypothetical protein